MERTTHQFVIFEVNGEIYGLNILIAESIESMYRITRVPKSPPEIVGVINLRGDIVPIISLRKILGLEDSYTDLTRLIIVRFEDYRLGLIVDRVYDILTVPQNNIQTNVDVLTDRERIFVSGIINMND